MSLFGGGSTSHHVSEWQRQSFDNPASSEGQSRVMVARSLWPPLLDHVYHWYPSIRELIRRLRGGKAFSDYTLNLVTSTERNKHNFNSPPLHIRGGFYRLSNRLTWFVSGWITEPFSLNSLWHNELH